MKPNYVFGPVPSRRLGRSLGVDLIPFKTCPYDCVYCQLGRTTCKTAERKEWMPLDAVLAEFSRWQGYRPDYVTLGGSGEPTLFSRLDELIAGIKAARDWPVAVLTNGALLGSPSLRQQLRSADLVVPSLDAGNPRLFQRVNRPDPTISFEEMLEGLIALREEFSGSYWLEVMVVDGYNATETEMRQIAECAARVRPERIQLNTVTRPPTDQDAGPVSRQQLEAFCSLFSPPAEVIADYRGIHQAGEFIHGREDVLAMLERRPCSVADIAEGLGMHRTEVIKYLEELRVEGVIVPTRVGKDDEAKQHYSPFRQTT